MQRESKASISLFCFFREKRKKRRNKIALAQSIQKACNALFLVLLCWCCRFSFSLSLSLLLSLLSLWFVWDNSHGYCHLSWYYDLICSFGATTTFRWNACCCMTSILWWFKACHSGRLLRMTKPVGSYKLDVATVYAQTGTVAHTLHSCTRA